MTDSASNDAYSLWDAFLDRWPLESLPQLTLRDYAKSGGGDSLSYWLESKTESLGSIWGGSAFKFGVYSRKNQSEKLSGSKLRYSDQYGWYGKYGPTAESAFEKVRDIIVGVSNAARRGDLAAIESADLGTVVKWKIAFLYQDRANPTIAPIYRRTSLQALLDKRPNETISSLHQRLMQTRQGQDLLAFGRSCWERLAVLDSSVLTTEMALEYLQTLESLEPIKVPTNVAAGFKTPDDRELLLALDNNKPTIYLSPGTWLTDDLQHLLTGVVMYSDNQSRSSSLKANAPSLWIGNAAVKVVLATRQALQALCEAYLNDDDQAPQPTDTSRVSATMTTFNTPLNQILFGPPGTGKTYATIERAMRILEPKLCEECSGPAGRAKLKKAFDEHLRSRQGRLRFVTFHQSFSYEDFIEGIRAHAEDEDTDGNGTVGAAGGLTYSIEDGVFKRICDEARRDKRQEEKVGIRDNPTVWKLSLESANDDGRTRTYCLKNGEARIGWKDSGDLTTEAFEKNSDLGSKEKSSLRNFSQGIMIGDIVLCLKTNRTIQAVGVVVGPYEYEPEPPDSVRKDYVHKLPVHWLATGLDFDITGLNGDRRLTLQTVYRLTRVTWTSLQEQLLAAGVKLEGLPDAPAKAKEPYVLIIDEINRGNVSRIFGELITLIEPDKRSGASEALEVTLPYSKKSFSVPSNVYLIGTMNTADRSLAGIDIALRRRFEFLEIMPQPELLENLTVSAQGQSVNLGKLLRTMNQRIEALLDRDHTLGHAFFLPLKNSPTLAALAGVFRSKVLPLLQEYFFDDWQRIQWVLNDHRKSDPAFRFVDAQGPSFDALFGMNVQVPRGRQNWNVNQNAFDRIESYAGVIDASALHQLQPSDSPMVVSSEQTA